KNSFGLGLHISKLMAKQLNGTLSVRSEQGRGSTFTLTVPVIDEQRVAKQIVKSYKLPADLRYVVIDDNPINTMFVKQSLQQFKNVQIFEDSDVGKAYLQSNAADVVITDLNMKELNGWDILDFVKDQNAAQGSKSIVIAVTSDEFQVSVRVPEGQVYQFDG